MSELKPCPTCGGQNLQKIQRRYVGCNDCGTTSRAHRWNTRAVLSEGTMGDLSNILELVESAPDKEEWTTKMHEAAPRSDLPQDDWVIFAAPSLRMAWLLRTIAKEVGCEYGG